MPRRSHPAREAVGQRIQAARQQAGVSQRGLATAVHVGQGAIGLYEQGMRSASVAILRDIADALNHPLPRLLAEEGRLVPVPNGGVADFISELERHPEDIPALLLFAQFLRWRRE